jgi:hypothetical protein
MQQPRASESASDEACSGFFEPECQSRRAGQSSILRIQPTSDKNDHAHLPSPPLFSDRRHTAEKKLPFRPSLTDCSVAQHSQLYPHPLLLRTAAHFARRSLLRLHPSSDMLLATVPFASLISTFSELHASQTNHPASVDPEE